jgi:hyperosmotically inducible periplasmic protein
MKKTSIKHIRVLGSLLCVSAVSLLAGVVATGCAGDRYHASTGENIDDASTTGRVKKALSADDQYKYSDVKVTTFKGTVQLSGFVNTRAQKSRAGDLAKNIEGAKDIENNITVKD